MGGGEAAVYVVVDHHDGGQAARADAPAGVQGEQPVAGDAAGGDVQLLLHRAEHIRGALYVAGGAQAHGDLVLPLGVQGEEGVEAGYCRKPMKESTEEMRERAKVIYNKYF